MNGMFSMHKRKPGDGSPADNQRKKQKLNHKPSCDHDLQVKHEDSSQIFDAKHITTPQPTLPSIKTATETAIALSNLLKSLSELDLAVKNDGAAGVKEVSDAIGSQNFKDCSALRKNLIDALEKSKHAVPLSSSLSLDAEKENTDRNLPQMMSGFQLTRWKSTEIPHRFPELPKILDPTLEIAAFTHSSSEVGSTSRLNYENLEWVGDSYMELAATLLISQTFVSYSPGQCSQVRERLIKNIQLAEYSREYDLLKRANLPRDFMEGDMRSGSKESRLIKIQGDLFEAYLGAVVLSDPVSGLQRAVQWVKDLWGMTLRKDIIAYERRGLQESPLWRLRGDKVDLAPKVQQHSPKDLLRMALKGPDVKIEYLDAAPEKRGKDKLVYFTVGVYLTGYGETKKQLAVATGSGKRQAGANAAELALQNHTMLKKYIDRKKVLEEIASREQTALD